jgi:hypothetical protein
MTGSNGLYGDYELIIDQCLAGDPNLKARVAVADKHGNRGGLAVLLNALHNRKARLTSFQQRIVDQLQADQQYWLEKQKAFNHITIRQNGKYQVKVTVEFNRYSATFDTLEDAQWWRDQMLSLGVQIKNS